MAKKPPAEPTRFRIVRKPGWADVRLGAGPLIHAGEETTALPLEEARARDDFDVVPLDDAADSPTDPEPETEAS